MIASEDSGLLAPFHRFSKFTALFAIGVGLLVLIGWSIGHQWLKSVLPSLVAMNPATAVLFVLLGLSLWWRLSRESGRHYRNSGWLAGVVAAIAALKLVGIALGWNSGVDTWLFQEQLATTAINLPNRMAPNTAVNFFLLGFAILLLDTNLPKGHRPSEYLAAAAGFIALLALLGYAYKISSMSGLARFIPMALNTATAFLLAVLGILSARPRSGCMSLITGDGPGGAMARLMLPGLVILITVIGLLRVQGEAMQLFDADLGVTLYTLAVIVLCIALTLWSALSLDRAAARQMRVEREREKAFSRLKHSEARVRSIVDTAYDAFISIDAGGLVIDWNSSAENMFGWARTETIGRRLSDLIVPSRYRDAHELGLQRNAEPDAGTGKLLNRRVEMTATRRQGGEFPIQMTIWPLGTGPTRIYNAFIGDITERVKAEKSIHKLHSELIANASQLEQSNRELEAFSYSVSHDLRAPLRHVDGYARMLQEDAVDKLDPEMRRYIDEISDAARRMGALIDDLLSFSRLGRKPIQKVDVDMGTLVKRVLQEHGDAAKGAVNICNLPAAHADPMLLKQVWTNLISNAIKYTTPRGSEARVEISGEQDESKVRYQIRDNGVGFDMRYADKLFGVFQRLHSDEEFDGTGVGLAIVQRIVTRHGGQISAQGEPGVGATFAFELPRHGHPDSPASIEEVKE
ncbi:ATP-binding protein [Dokdonella sp.]|uniref:ATP-binding protein n=1 Tax=Dokdonella sp. TaxID=2291710 RepID=UPI003C4CBFE0